jgi:hypothetical protein
VGVACGGARRASAWWCLVFTENWVRARLCVVDAHTRRAPCAGDGVRHFTCNWISLSLSLSSSSSSSLLPFSLCRSAFVSDCFEGARSPCCASAHLCIM